MRDETLLSHNKGIVNLCDRDNIDSIHKKVRIEWDKEVIDSNDTEYMVKVDKTDDSSSESKNESVKLHYLKKLYKE